MNCEAVVKATVVGLIVAGLSMTIACTTTPRAEAPEQPPAAVQTASVDVVDFAVPFEAGGVVRARATAQLASRLLAPIVDVHARAGDRVRRGAVLVTLDSREMLAERTRAAAGSTSAAESARAAEADVRASESALVLARAMHERMNGLHAKRSATSQELDQAVAALATAEAQLSAARARLASARAASEGAQAANESAQIGVTYSSLSAPFDGIVTERHADPGSMAVPGVALLTIEDTAAFRLEVQVDEARAAAIRPDQTVAVRFDHIADGDEWANARVGEIGRVDAAGHSFLVKIDLPPPLRVQSGLFGRARFDGPVHRTLAVPASALLERGQLSFVFLVDDGRARLRPISAGARLHDHVEVLAGLREHDVVVLNPPTSLSDGARVKGAAR